VDDCVQLHGGYGYILDFAIARMWVDGRLDKILGCTDDAVSAIVGEDADALRERA
jgi:acyl-CoA dehydrogenase